MNPLPREESTLQRIITAFLIALIFLPSTGCKPFNFGQSPLLRLEHVHNAGTTCLAFDGSGTRLASGGYRGEIVIWSVPSGEKLSILKAHRKKIRGLCWPDDTRLISGDAGGRLILWRLKDGHSEHSMDTPSPMTSVAFLTEQELVVSGHKDGWIRSFKLPDLHPAQSFQIGSPVLSVAVDPIGNRLAVSAKGGRLAVLSPSLGLIKDLASSSRNAWEIQFSPDGRQLAGAAWYKLLFWDLNTGRLSIKGTKHWGKVASVDYSPDGKRLASIGRITDSSVLLLNLETGLVERRLEAHELCGAAVRFSPHGRFLASGSDDESVRLYDLSEPAEQ
jgi:WD40 repeat protein